MHTQGFRNIEHVGLLQNYTLRAQKALCRGEKDFSTNPGAEEGWEQAVSIMNAVAYYRQRCHALQ